jgi:hypothetical protein
MEVLRLLLNGLEIMEQFETKWNKEFNRDFAVGDTVTLKKPARFIIRDGLAYTPQAIVRQSTTISLDQIFGIDFEWDDYEAAVKMERSKEELRKNYLDPAASKLAQELESRGALFAYQNTPSVFGALGTNPTTSSPILDAENRLQDMSAPMGDRKLILSSRMHSSFLANQNVQFNPASEIARQYKKGSVGSAWGWDWYRANSLRRHTAGTWVGAVTVSTAGQSGSTLNVVCTTNDTFKKGDSFSILNVNFVNPNTLRVPSGNQVKHFKITADTIGVGSAAALPIFPSIVGPGSPYQNVDALPAAGAALTLWPGTASPNGKSGTVGLGLSRMAFGLVWATFDSPKAVEMATTTKDEQTGASVSFVRQWDIDARKNKNRYDMCVGFGNLYPDECAVAVVGA